MKLYEGKIVDRGLNRRFRKKAETRDAVVWDLDDDNKIARCKIQGSDEYVLCHYPRNWQTLPPWAKRGNAVRISHKGGVRGYYEITGHGRAIPSPVIGNQLPTVETLYDGILTGGAVWAIEGMWVRINTTTFRIDGTEYTTAGYVSGAVYFDAILKPPISGTQINLDAVLYKKAGYIFLDAYLESQGTYELVFDAAPSAPNGRYDLIVVDASGVPVVVKGIASSSPVMPSIPAGYVKIAHVMIPGGVTSILNSYVNAKFDIRKPIQVSWLLGNGSGTITDQEFEFHLTNDYPYCSVTMTVLDQYGYEYPDSHAMSVEVLGGTGEISLNSGGPYSSSVVKNTGLSYGRIYYQRNQLETEVTPTLQVTIGSLVSIYRVQLLNNLGVQI